MGCPGWWLPAGSRLSGLGVNLAGPVFAFDSFGCGLSSRPAHQQLADSEKARLEAENFFVNGLEAGLVSSGWSAAEWSAFLEPMGTDNWQGSRL